MIARPALPAVLAALTDLPVEAWSVWSEWDAITGQRIVVDDRAARVHPVWMRNDYSLLGPVAWITTDPAEAWEILDARGLLPPEGSRGFWCRRCDGRGSIALGGEYPERDYCDECSVEDVMATGGVRACGWATIPATIPDLVAWASLGADAIVTAEALCREIGPALSRMGYGVDRCERVVWRVKDADRRVRGAIVEQWRKDGDAVLMANGTLDIPGGYAAFHRETIAPVRALWDAGLALERVGAECVLCVPPIGGAT